MYQNLSTGKWLMTFFRSRLLVHFPTAATEQLHSFVCVTPSWFYLSAAAATNGLNATIQSFCHPSSPWPPPPSPQRATEINRQQQQQKEEEDTCNWLGIQGPRCGMSLETLSTLPTDVVRLHEHKYFEMSKFKCLTTTWKWSVPPPPPLYDQDFVVVVGAGAH